MSEGEVVDKLIGYTDLLLAGVSVFFTIVSAYVAALNYFVRRANVAGRIAAFAFFTFVMGMLLAVLAGAQRTHVGLIARLQELEAQGGLSAVGRSVLQNSISALPGTESSAGAGVLVSIDAIVMAGVYGGVALTYLALFLLTFAFRWGEQADNAVVRR